MANDTVTIVLLIHVRDESDQCEVYVDSKRCVLWAEDVYQGIDSSKRSVDGGQLSAINTAYCSRLCVVWRVVNCVNLSTEQSGK